MKSTDGDIPQGRELSFAWLAGTVMTGLTSVLLMGAALYVSFLGQDTFSTAYEALQIEQPHTASATSLLIKTDRLKPVAQTRSDREIVEASIRETVDGRGMIRRQPFVRIRATLATSATALSDNIPAYDPVALLSRSQALAAQDDLQVSTDVYGAEVEGEVAVQTASLPVNIRPAVQISDKKAAEFVRAVIEGNFTDGDSAILGYAPIETGVRDLGIMTGEGISGVAENVTVMPKTHLAEDAGFGRSERVLTIREQSSLEDVLIKNGFTAQMIGAITKTLRNVYPSTILPAGARLRILFGPSRTSNSLIPYRMSIYVQDVHAATVALTDRGQYVLGLAPPAIEFPEEDTEEINVNNLPTIYRSIWETARKHDVPDEITDRIVAMFAYDLDLNKRIAPGDSIEILETPPDASARTELLYVGLKLGNTTRELYRFRTDDGTVDFYDPNGQSGKRFLQRRPLKGGGRISSRFGYRKHPVFGTYKLHSGVDLSAPRNTPIYAAGDGVVETAKWASGYGRYVKLKHVNGFETAYGHMNKIADGMAPGVRVRQGQIIGYVGTTGVSTGNHLHFEIKINGRFVDPLSVKLPRDKALPPQYQRQFAETVAQMQDLMQRDAKPMTVASTE
ncbi:M23 family metallopeptidase [Mariluticola halotolerans]|uniref:M23 family metallopeptidase n=1 Tax=Mariluticola halotolerans TaxID=2909283 RepID=UPI0026E47782|nr:M23 family metallopeptidase [Mariluticola halotolerans]UJQ93864.1 M23 family metallopeptidase [Mariluticola halotolerans]